MSLLAPSSRHQPKPGTSDARPASGMRQLWIVVLASLWIATVCNVAL